MFRKLRLPTLPTPPKPSLGWFTKTPRQPDPNAETIRLNADGFQAPPNSPRHEKPGKVLFGTPDPSEFSATQQQQFHDASLHASSDETPRSQLFFDELVPIDVEDFALITEKPEKNRDRSSELRQSLQRIERPTNDRPAKRSGRKTASFVPLEREVPVDRPVLQGLELKRAAAVLDPDHPLDLVPVFNAWLTSAPCKKHPLRLKTPGLGEPFMSRSRFSAKDSVMFDHDADHDVPEQMAAYELLYGLASCQALAWPDGLNEALANLKSYLEGLKPGACFHAIKDQQLFKRVKDTQALRDLLKAVEKALPPNPQ